MEVNCEQQGVIIDGKAKKLHIYRVGWKLDSVTENDGRFASLLQHSSPICCISSYGYVRVSQNQYRFCHIFSPKVFFFFLMFSSVFYFFSDIFDTAANCSSDMNNLLAAGAKSVNYFLKSKFCGESNGRCSSQTRQHSLIV